MACAETEEVLTHEKNDEGDAAHDAGEGRRVEPQQLDPQRRRGDNENRHPHHPCVRAPPQHPPGWTHGVILLLRRVVPVVLCWRCTPCARHRLPAHNN